MTDAAHLLSDLAGYMIGIFALWASSKKATSRSTFGYHRAEVLGALISIAIVWLATGVLVYEAVQRIITPEVVDGRIMFYVALGGLGINFVLLAVLSGSGHGHSHGLGGGDHGHSHGGGGHGHGNKAKAGGHGHAHGQAHRGGHGHAHGHAEPGGHGHAHGQTDTGNHGHAHGQAHRGGHGHAHGQTDTGGHGHAHGQTDTGGHGHAHGQTDTGGHGHAHGQTDTGNHGHAHGQTDTGGHGHAHGQTDTGGHGHAHGQADTGGHGHAHGQTDTGGHGHAHGHAEEEGHNHGSTHSEYLEVGDYGHDGLDEEWDDNHHKEESMNVRAAAIHVIGDMVQSVGVVIAGALIWYNPDWHLADPICTFVFALLVLLTTAGMLREIVDVLMERTPQGVHTQLLADKVMDIEGVTDVHCMHAWALSPGKYLLSAHIQVTHTVHKDTVLIKALEIINKNTNGKVHSTLQVTSADLCSVEF
eukprot:CAMPEP_0197864946 /NCGR_PEP_ID=MMETSP1438-20131217/43378_1 /TAXON_ID=1461541 /ORGANISM="Pterosperma sp., Strain CCMP1384" /LENGTH=471 /DNA_ID=CAMNT_0043483329 /DNA_START=254 /DNA_END=1669 /DNA_ORIENTATION=-